MEFSYPERQSSLTHPPQHHTPQLDTHLLCIDEPSPAVAPGTAFPATRRTDWDDRQVINTWMGAKRWERWWEREGKGGRREEGKGGALATGYLDTGCKD
jgi:hypothetical protein